MNNKRQKLDIRRSTKSLAMTGDIEGLGSETHGRNNDGESEEENCDMVEEGASQLEELFGDIAQDDVSDDDNNGDLLEDDTILHVSDSSEDEYEDNEDMAKEMLQRYG
ncbi:hypothetical protein YC2023_017419 [Brassica napus]